MLPLVAPSAVIELAFDPIVTFGDLSVRLETLGVALAIFLGLVLAALLGRRTPVDASKPPDAPGEEPGDSNHLRADDLLYIAIAAVPGAVIGARIGYALVHWDFYQSNAAALLDIGRGGLQLSLGVVGGILTASIVARLLGAPVGRWMHALAVPLLLALALGKGAMILGGSGQGQLTDIAWATAYLGPGPWGSLAPQLPANPSQAYEALATGGVMLVVIAFISLGTFRGRNGGAFLLGLGLWAIARALVATTWRDPAGDRAPQHGPGDLDRDRLGLAGPDGVDRRSLDRTRPARDGKSGRRRRGGRPRSRRRADMARSGDTPPDLTIPQSAARSTSASSSSVSSTGLVFMELPRPSATIAGIPASSSPKVRSPGMARAAVQA